KCDWYDADKQKSRIVQDGALTSIRVDRLWYLSDSFVLATQANQVFYISDPKLGTNWRVVHQFNHRHIFIGEFDNQNDVDDMEFNDDEYQDEELSNEDARVVEISTEIEHSLRRDDVVLEISWYDKSWRQVCQRSKIGPHTQYKPNASMPPLC
ncbi:hypothetical protein LINPERHAP1_LOCUS24414, partial [Linum perenne]